MEEYIKRDGLYYKKIASIAIPIILQMTIRIGIGIIDSLMVGRLGVYPMAGVGAGNEVFYVLGIALYGLGSGTSVYVAQYFGHKDRENIKKVFCVNICIAMVVAILCVAAGMIFAPKLVWIFAREEEVIRYGTIYIRGVGISYLFSSASQVININSRAVQKVKAVTAISIGTVLTNVVLNYIFIYGKLWFKPMGVFGAALATDVSTFLQLVILLIYIYGTKDHPLAVPPNEFFKFGREDVNKVFKMSVPVMISEGGWSIANALYGVAYGLISAEAFAAAQAVTLTGKMCQAFYGGFANGAGILLGEELGKGHKRQAMVDGKIFQKIVVAMGVAFTAILFLMGPVVAGWYKFDENTTMMICNGIRVFSAFHLMKMIGYVNVCGILRAGGDTKFCMLLDLGTSWLISVPVVFLGVTVFHVGLPVAIACTYIGEFVKGTVCLKRFYSEKWIKLMV